MDKVHVIGQMDNTIDHTFESANRVYDTEGISPTIPTCCGGGHQPKIIDVQIAAMRGRYNENDEIEQHLEINNEKTTNCLTSVAKDNLVMETKIEKIGQISSDGSQYGTVLSETGLSATLGAGTHGYANNCIQQKYKIRKLTPRECFRLMNFDDKDYNAAETVNSNTQLYKQAGNSIVVACLAAIFSQLNIQGKKTWNDMSLEEKYELTKVNKEDS